MDWRIKCLALQLMRALPAAAPLHRVLQRHVTGRLLLDVTEAGLEVHRHHVANFLRLGYAGRALEFGAGGHLLTALLLSAAGAREVLAYDIDRLASVEQVNHVIRQLRSLQVAGTWAEVADLGSDLAQRYRIRYVAPGDARATGLESGSVDFICSTSVLEHIGEADIARILAECARISAPSALWSFSIDYRDHYATFDRSIGRGNFYRYSDRQWAKYNPPRHFQNRLRHSDFESLFDSLGLRTISAVRWSRGRPEEIAGFAVAPRFRRYSQEDLLTHSGRYLLAMPG